MVKRTYKGEGVRLRRKVRQKHKGEGKGTRRQSRVRQQIAGERRGRSQERDELMHCEERGETRRTQWGR